MADAATDSYDRDCALALLSSTQNALYEIEQALKRIKEGTYGVCELTQEPIEPERLKAIPWTRYCVAAQSQIEARKGATRVQLGPVGTCLLRVDGADTGEDESTLQEAEKEAA
jgi:DnaK suppressor protein